MVEMIILKKGIAYPEGFREQVKQFNHGLLRDYDPYMYQLLEQFPGAQIRHLEIDSPSEGHAQEYAALTAIREKAHQDHFNPGAHSASDANRAAANEHAF